MTAEELVLTIEKACEAFEEDRATGAVRDLTKKIREDGVTISATLAQKVLKPLRRKRYFAAALLLGDAIFESGQREPLVQLVYAQALIDSGRVAAAIPFLERLIAEATPRSHAANEARGLLGRAYKQLYVNGGGERDLRTDYLVRAFNAYYDVYRTNPEMTWHGINAAALMRRAADEDLRNFPKIEPFVDRLYAALTTVEKKDVWGLVTLAEASLAIGKEDEARRWYDEFAKQQGADAFEIGSALRQLEEVWRLSEDKSPGRELLPLLRARLLKEHGGEVRITSEQVKRDLSGPAEADLQAIFGKESARAVTWYRQGLECCLPVCKIETINGEPHGTGFLVDGELFHHPSLAGERLVLTNHHVVSKTHYRAIRPDHAQMRFTALEDKAEQERTYEPQMIWTSPELDATLLRIREGGEPPASLMRYRVSQDRPVRADEKKTRVYVIGHPMGAPLAISLYDNDLVDSDDRRLHYLAPTLQGNSGSPVFDEFWQLVGLHHAGSETMARLHDQGGTYKANEALWIGAITEAVKASDTIRPRRT